jgi:hypothetical protein
MLIFVSLEYLKDSLFSFRPFIALKKILKNNFNIFTTCNIFSVEACQSTLLYVVVLVNLS